ncbi:hypothetical protein BTO00_14135 [Vibrio campbellii]|uniref:DUF2971 domain-containing protein n=1 Tax=Vibrio campbellii TaxID=680 RepID=UPI000CF52F50|nr:DUF2971 domain-containing protein [Vibrio campbellii]PQJ43139.1 hypothetical protein BTO00_14135 [Vibrio campbellii]
MLHSSGNKHVYKYRNFSKNHLQAMLENKVWYSVSSQFNDPFDSSEHLFSHGTSAKRLLNHFKENDTETYNKIKLFSAQKGVSMVDFLYAALSDSSIQLDNLLHSICVENLKRSYILSTCQAWDNVSMWSHYADYHKGFCVKYNVEKLVETSGEVIRYHSPVIYEEKSIDPLELFYADGNRFEVIDKIISTKSNVFLLENEYRFILNEIQRLPSETNDCYKPSSIPVSHRPEAIEAIYFGMNTSLSDKLMLQKLLSDSQHIDYFDVVPSENFSLVEKPFNF